MKKLLAEFIGTATLVFIGCGTASLIGCDVIGGYLATALAFGLAIVAIAYSVGTISGGHVNPAVSLGMLMSKRMKLKEFLGYIVSQFLGAAAGAGLIAYLIGFETGLGANRLFEGDLVKTIIIEAVLTFIFVLTILLVTDEDKGVLGLEGIVIGGTLAGLHIIGIGLDGTSVNPARSFGPALLSYIGSGDSAELYPLIALVAGPLAGATIAALAYILFKSEKQNEEK